MDHLGSKKIPCAQNMIRTGKKAGRHGQDGRYRTETEIGKRNELGPVIQKQC